MSPAERLWGQVFPRVAELARENGDRLESPLFPGFTLPLADRLA